MTAVCEGSTVSVHYTGRLEDGSVFDSSREREPLQFVAGSGNLIEGVSQGVLGMEEGESKTVTVPPEKGYGYPNPELKQTIPKSEVPEGIKVGDRLQAVAGGQQFSVWVSSIADDQVEVDANHPLAGHTLEFELEVVSVGPAEEQQFEAEG